LENEAIADEILSALQQLLEAAGPEWTLEFLNAGLQEAGGGQPPQGAPPEVMSQGGPGAMPPMPGQMPQGGGRRLPAGRQRLS
jgi:hypothetical protein